MAKQNEELAAIAAMVEAVDKATEALEKLILLHGGKVEDAGYTGEAEEGPETKEKPEKKNTVTVFELSDMVAKSTGFPRFLIYIIINEALDAVRDGDLVIIREKEQDDGE